MTFSRTDPFLKSHRSLKPGSWSRPISLPHRSPKLTLTGFGSGHGSVTLLPKHERPQGGRYHVSSVATSWCGGPCAGNATCPEGCSKLLGPSKPLPHRGVSDTPESLNRESFCSPDYAFRIEHVPCATREGRRRFGVNSDTCTGGRKERRTPQRRTQPGCRTGGGPRREKAWPYRANRSQPRGSAASARLGKDLLP